MYAKRLSLAQQLFVLQLAVILALGRVRGRSRGPGARRDSEHTGLTLSSALAQGPEMRSAFIAADPSQTLQPLAE